MAVGLLAGALAMFGVALAPPAGAAASVDSERLAGATRYGTAAAIAADEAFTTPTTAIVATGQNFPDALAASTLAGANAAAPIILTETASYTAEAKSGLAALKAKGVTAVTIVGGTAAVSDAVETAIKGDGFTVSRVAGDDRYETAAEIATAANTKAAGTPIAGLKAAFFATGLNFPDALAGGPAAYSQKIPLLLVNDTVPASTANAISTLGIKKAYILGGTAAVSSAVEGQLVVATGNPATRIAGTDRFTTATAIADFEQATLAYPMTSAILATGNNFPDALAAGPLGGQLKAPVILTSSLPEASRAWLDKNSKTLTKLYVSGGTSAIDAATVAAAEAAAETVNNDIPANAAVTARPELISASIRSTTTTGLQQGTVVRYTFDTAVNLTSAQATFFHLAGRLSGDRLNGSTVAAVSGDANSLDVNFAGLTSASTAAGYTVATVQFDAVDDATGASSPEGDASLSSTGTSTPSLQAGITTAPDLTSVANFRTATTTQTFVDFVFDQAATNVTNAGYHLLDLAGAPINCTYDNGGTTTATITVVCPGALTTAGISRGYIDVNTVNSGASTVPANVANANVQAADVSNSGNTGLPDIVSATFTEGGTSADTVTVVFDQPITSANIGNFFGYTSTAGTSVAPTSVGTSTTSPNNVLLTFDTTSMQSGVGVYVLDDAVRAATGPTIGQANQEDEVGFANANTTSTSAGRTPDPDLVSVVRTAAVDLFNVPTGGFNVTYNFDEALQVAAGITASRFHLYAADGTRYDGSTCAVVPVASGASTTSAIRCTAYVISGTATAASNAQVQGAVLGTVEAAAATANDNGATNTAEGGEVVS